MLPPFDPWLSATAASEVAFASLASARSLRALQQQRLRLLVAHAVRHSAFYAERLRGVDPATVALEALPVVRKRELMARFEAWVTDPALGLDALRRFAADRARIAEPFLGRYVVWESSGSSGEPALFVQDAAALAVYDALEALRRPAPEGGRWFDPGYVGARIAFVGATGGHFAGTVSVERLKRLNPVLARNLRSLSFLQRTDALVAELNALLPTVLSTYPSAALLLAEERLAGRLRAAPREVWTGGETLTASTRHVVAEAFGCRVVDSYGASEFLTLACACRHGTLHLNSDWAILEPVDEQGRAVPQGETGATTLLTNLANRVQPLIRYDLGDRVRIRREACACGSALPAIDVGGRSDDSLVLAAAGGTVRVLPLALTTVLEDDAGLYDFQLEQRGPAELLLRTPLEGGDAKAALKRARRALDRFLHAQGARGVRVHCHCGEACRRGRGGKVQRVVAAAPR